MISDIVKNSYYAILNGEKDKIKTENFFSLFDFTLKLQFKIRGNKAILLSIDIFCSDKVL